MTGEIISWYKIFWWSMGKYHRQNSCTESWYQLSFQWASGIKNQYQAQNFSFFFFFCCFLLREEGVWIGVGLRKLINKFQAIVARILDSQNPQIDQITRIESIYNNYATIKCRQASLEWNPHWGTEKWPGRLQRGKAGQIRAPYRVMASLCVLLGVERYNKLSLKSYNTNCLWLSHVEW